MKQVEYTQVLEDESGEDRIRISFTQHRGKILKFVVQYYSRIGSKWRTITRIDTCHGVPHQHMYYMNGREYWMKLGSADYNKSFTELSDYVVKNFKKIKANFFYSR